MRLFFLTGFVFAASAACSAQWQILDGHTTADLRGIDNVGGGVAWASGTNGTVLRTEDAGVVWQLCAVPPGAEKLDFRGIQAFDNNTAIVMSSGPGESSRLYKTTDGCQTWQLVFVNPDKDGFLDAIRFQPFDPRPGARNTKQHLGVLIGDPVDGKVVVFISQDSGDHWTRMDTSKAKLAPNESLFAASNTSLVVAPAKNGWFCFVTGGSEAQLFSATMWLWPDKRIKLQFFHRKLAMPASKTAGAFSMAPRYHKLSDSSGDVLIVGGDYALPNVGSVSIYSPGHVHIFGSSDVTSTTNPSGYRSAVAYDEVYNTWITVGPNGTDISTDDGRNWRALKPGPVEPPDADQHWNALSLPFVVGPKGRIGVLREDALPKR
jgi:hypothetical protein